MNQFFRKVLMLAGIYTLGNIFFSSLSFFENGKFITLTMDGWTVLIFFWWIFLALFIIGIFKLLSLRINNFIYESDLFIIYVALNIVSARWFEVNFIGLLENKYEFIYFILMFLYYSSIVTALIVFWKYRIEITFSMFLGELLYSFNIIENLYNNIHGKRPVEIIEGSIILIISLLVFVLVLILRNCKIYDFRNRRDKWLESMNEGPYRKLSK